MVFGLPTLIELQNIEDHAILAARTGLKFIEINMSFPQYTAAALDIDELVRLKKDHGVFYTIHADEFLNPFDFNIKVSDTYFSLMIDTIEVAKAIGAPVINIHLQKGIYVTLPGNVVLLTNVYKEEYLSAVRRFIKLCEDAIGDSGIKICIENVDSNAFTSSQLSAVEMFMQSSVFALTLDTGHELALGFPDTHVYERYPQRLLHMHLHDCKGKKPHLALGDGDVAVKEKLSLFKGETCLIEVKTVEGLLKSVEYLNRNNYL